MYYVDRIKLTFIQLNLLENESARLYIENELGKLIDLMEINNNSNANNINFKLVNDGIYFLKIVTSAGRIFNEKLIILN